jgi:hypothetical protein
MEKLYFLYIERGNKMKLIPYDIRKIDPNKYKKSKNYLLLTDFMESDMDCAKVENYTQKCARHCSTSLNISIKRYRMGGIRSIVRDGEVFLIKVKD